MTMLDRIRKGFLTTFPIAAAGFSAFAADVPQVGRYRPAVAGPSDEGKQAIARFRLPEGSKMRLLAAEPMLANPVAFGFDEKGRAYVVETFRHHKGVTDIRSHMDWLEDDLASRTVADRVAMYKKHLKDEFPTYNVEQERVKLLEDTDGDGVYDKDTIFADGFKDPADGLGAGVLARKGDVYFTCLPKLWLLKDTTGDGKADIRTVLHDGFGIHVGFLGHDLHGLKIGPDGRLYFSIGDRGINVVTKEGRRLNLPDTGSVLRCELDGSNLEIYAWGLRNPQELAFDEYGNLFTHDNNSDSGDKARVTYLVEGGDHGWRIGYQFFDDRGPWNREKMWHPPFVGQPAYIVPPIDNLGNGPSGITYNPGLGLGGRFPNTFFVADFKGSNTLSGVRTFTLEPKGAGYRMNSTTDFLWGMCVTDVDFAPDGAMVLSDWVDGWAQPGKGRLYELTYPDMAARADLIETKKLIAEDLTKRAVADLVVLLDHADMRVRQEAQFALVTKGTEGRTALESAAAGKTVKTLLGRLHGIWGLGMIARKDASALTPIRGLLSDTEPEARFQAAEILGDAKDGEAATVQSLIALLKDDSPRVRFMAAQAMGQIGAKAAASPVRDAVAEAGDTDPWLRHSYSLALSRIGDEAVLADMIADARPPVRRAAAVALRRSASAEVARLLEDDNLDIALEAARAIHDEPVEAAMPALASLSQKQYERDPALLRRVIAANARLGKAGNAMSLVGIALDKKAPEDLRVKALEELTRWDAEQPRDSVVGVWRPIPARNANEAAAQLAAFVNPLLADGSEAIRRATAEATGALEIKAAGPALKEMALDSKLAGPTRAEALRALKAIDSPDLQAVVELAVADKDTAFRSEGRRMLASLEPGRAVGLIRDVLENATMREKQAAFAMLASIRDPRADAVLADWLQRLIAGKVPAALKLDLLEAGRQRATDDKSELAPLVDRYLAGKDSSDPLAAWIECLEGGRAREGRTVVLNNTAAACLRCHLVQDKGGNVGPALNGIGGRLDRRTLLEAIVAPDAKIAEGFKSIVLALKDGTIVAGVLKSETADEVIVVTSDAAQIAVPTSEIEERAAGISAMPADLSQKLSRQEIRDVVEFLSGLK